MIVWKWILYRVYKNGKSQKAIGIYDTKEEAEENEPWFGNYVIDHYPISISEKDEGMK